MDIGVIQHNPVYVSAQQQVKRRSGPARIQFKIRASITYIPLNKPTQKPGKVCLASRIPQWTFCYHISFPFKTSGLSG